jgi:hypothetical protein
VIDGSGRDPQQLALGKPIGRRNLAFRLPIGFRRLQAMGGEPFTARKSATGD